MDQMDTLCLWLTPLLPVVNCALAHFQHMGEFADNSEEYQNEDSSSKERHNRHRKEKKAQWNQSLFEVVSKFVRTAM